MLNGRVNARVALAASLVVLAQLAVAGRAAAETPVVAPLVDSGRLGHPQRHGHRSLKPFLHHRGADSLARAKEEDRKSTRLNSSHGYISYAVFCLKKKKVFLSESLLLVLVLSRLQCWLLV